MDDQAWIITHLANEIKEGFWTYNAHLQKDVYVLPIFTMITGDLMFGMCN